MTNSLDELVLLQGICKSHHPNGPSTASWDVCQPGCPPTEADRNKMLPQVPEESRGQNLAGCRAQCSRPSWEHKESSSQRASVTWSCAIFVSSCLDSVLLFLGMYESKHLFTSHRTSMPDQRNYFFQTEPGGNSFLLDLPTGAWKLMGSYSTKEGP